MKSGLFLPLLGLCCGLAAVPAAAQGYARSGFQATLKTNFHEVAANVTIVDGDTLQVDNFYYDGGGDGLVYFYLGASDNYASFLNGLAVGPNLYGTVYSGASLTLDLPSGYTLDGYGAVSVWCVPMAVNFGSGSFEYPRTGSTAELATIIHNVSGRVTIADQDTVQMDNFYYDGGGIDVYFYLGVANTSTAFRNGLAIGPPLQGRPYNGESLTIDLPAGETLDGWNAISVWCVTARVNFGSGSFETDFDLSAGGACSGLVRLDATGATPGGDLALIYARNLGSAVLPPGPCAGTVLGLGPAKIQLARTGVATAAGDWIVQARPPAGACGGYLQLLDLVSCRVSNVVPLP